MINLSNGQAVDFAKKLINANSEEEVVKILEFYNLWNESNWNDVDSNLGNYSTIGNQQSNAEAALVEKIINSVDAVFIKECLVKRIDPSSDKAPKSISEAQKQFFNIPNGKLSNLDTKIRAELANNIWLHVSGDKNTDNYPCVSIIDLGEGQHPDDFKKTFLSLNKSNKISINFVQGRFGMGGTGALPFSSQTHNFQLIISKRHPELVLNKSDENPWGITLIRRFRPTNNMRNSVYKYLCIDDKILRFSAESLPVMNTGRTSNIDNICSGSLIKLFNYQFSTGRLKSDATRHLHNQLSLLMPDIALPIQVYDSRHPKSPIKTLNGLSVRLTEDKRENIEEGFPGTGEFVFSSQKVEYSLYAFKPGKKKDTYPKKEGVVFSYNGQCHSTFDKQFFDYADMNFLSDSILVVVDCSKIDRSVYEDMFMTSRDRMKSGHYQKEMRKCLISEIKNHSGLRELREKRQREDLENKIGESRPLKDILENLIKNSATLSRLLISGGKLTDPFNFSGAGNSDKFQGNEYPDFFKLIKEYPEKSPKKCPFNQAFRVKFETNVTNDYFKRDNNPGELSVFYEGIPCTDSSINLWNGTATLNISLPSEIIKIGDSIHFKTEVTDGTRSTPFTSEFYVKIEKPSEQKESSIGKRTDPLSLEASGDRHKPSSLHIPEPIPVTKSEWVKYNFDEKSALKVKQAGENKGYLFYINVDNIHLLTEIKGHPKVSPEIIKTQYSIGMVTLGMSLLDAKHSKANNDNSAESRENDGKNSVYDDIEHVSRAFSAYLLPTITTLGTLDS